MQKNELVKQEIISRYKPFLEQVLTPNRLKHSFGVMQVIEELASVYQLDHEKAVLAALLHDAGKDLSRDQQQQLIVEAGIEIEPYTDLDYILYLHGPVGACFVQKELGITDPFIIDAISMHSFCGEGDNFHSPFVWCLRFADILDPNRRLSNEGFPIESKWFQEGALRLRKIIFDGKLLEAALFHTGWLIMMFEEKKFPVHPNMRNTYQALSDKLIVDNSF